MRGKLYQLRDSTYYKGITPADAGKTKKAELTGIARRDHPRGCGENLTRCLQ